MAPDRHAHEAMALVGRSDCEFVVDIGHVDGETFEASVAYNETVPSMVGAAVRNDEGELLCLDHRDYGGWVLPGGRVEPGECLPVAAARETREESGVEAEIVRPLLVINYVPRHDGRSTSNFLVIFEGEATDPETADDPGIEDEDIVEARWTKTIPQPTPDNWSINRIYSVVTDRFAEISLAE